MPQHNNKSHLEVFIFIDALGWDIAQSHSFLANLLPYRAPVQMQMGYSCTAIPTILTGVHPDTHGHLSFFFKAQGKSPFRIFKYLAPFLKPDSFWRRGRVRNIVSKILKFFLGYSGYFQIYAMPFSHLHHFDYCEKSDLFAQNGLAPVQNLRDILDTSKLKYIISDWHKPELFNLQEAENAAADPNMSFIFAYNAAFDSLLHDNVGNDTPISQHLNFYEKHITKIAENAAKNHDSFNITVISDHGMTPLRGTCDLENLIRLKGLQFEKDYISCLDSTMARFWYVSKDAQNLIHDAFSQSPGHWLSIQEKKQFGIFFPDNKFGEDIFLMDPGVQIVPSDMGIKPLHGMHGFIPSDKDSLASILSSSPFNDEVHICEVADFFKLMQARINKLAHNTSIKQGI